MPFASRSLVLISGVCVGLALLASTACSSNSGSSTSAPAATSTTAAASNPTSAPTTAPTTAASPTTAAASPTAAASSPTTAAASPTTAAVSLSLQSYDHPKFSVLAPSVWPKTEDQAEGVLWNKPGDGFELVIMAPVSSPLQGDAVWRKFFEGYLPGQLQALNGSDVVVKDISTNPSNAAQTGTLFEFKINGVAYRGASMAQQDTAAGNIYILTLGVPESKADSVTDDAQRIFSSFKPKI